MNPPSGIVTFLFTDIEGSTKLSQEFADTLQTALEKHHVILQNAVETNNGFVFKITGDAFCCAFENASDAVKAAVDANVNLEKEKWNDAVIRVRTGIHSGEAEWDGDNYKGYITMARSQRVMSAANGGQIIISNDAYKNYSVKNSPVMESSGIPSANDISFRDLGERKLKDLIQPIKLFQILTTKLPADFPPLKTLDARPNNLPIQLTSFIGREKEMAKIKKLILSSRLLTLQGPGGTGKTRLSLQAGADLIDDFENGVWFIELASVNDESLLPQLISSIFGIKEQPGQLQEDNLMQYLKDKEMLIILDNCEHLINACAHLSEKLLEFCSGLKIMATSREALRCSGEKTHQVLPMTIPDPENNLSAVNLTQFEAVRLFIDRALAVNRNFSVNNDNAPALAQICFQLDGIPLAIELAAARIKILSLEKIQEKLNDRFRLLTGGKRTALPRQQTLRALIDWSYDLLNEKERLLLQRLSVFSGGWTMEAAEEICSDEIISDHEIIDLLTGLLDKSLIISIENSDSLRFNMLESLKQYAKEKLENNINIMRKHLTYFKRMSDHREMISNGIEQTEWVRLVESERSNIRMSIQWAVENDPNEASDFINNISEFWNIKGYFSEGLKTCQSILDKSSELSEINRATNLYNTGLMSNYLGNIAEADRYGKEALSIFRNLNNKERMATCLILLGANLSYNQSVSDEILEYYNEALLITRELNLKNLISQVMYNISFVQLRKGDHEAALKSKLEALNISKETGNTHQITLTLASLGVSEFRKENFEIARTYSEESLALSHRLGDKNLISINLTNLGCIYSGLKNFEKALSLLNESIIIYKECGYKTNMIPALYYLGDVVTNLGDNGKAIKLFKESIQTGSDLGIDFFLNLNFYGLGITYFNIDDFENSVKYFSFMEMFDEKYNGSLGKLKMENGLSYLKKLNEILGNATFEKYRKEILHLNKDEMISFALDKRS